MFKFPPDIIKTILTSLQDIKNNLDKEQAKQAQPSTNEAQKISANIVLFEQLITRLQPLIDAKKIDLQLKNFFYAYMEMEAYLLHSNLTIPYIATLLRPNLLSFISVMQECYYGIRNLFDHTLDKTLRTKCRQTIEKDQPQEVKELLAAKQTTLQRLIIVEGFTEGGWQQNFEKFKDDVTNIQKRFEPNWTRTVVYQNNVQANDAYLAMNTLYRYAGNDPLALYRLIIDCRDLFPVVPTKTKFTDARIHIYSTALNKLYLQMLALFIYNAEDLYLQALGSNQGLTRRTSKRVSQIKVRDQSPPQRVAVSAAKSPLTKKCIKCNLLETDYIRTDPPRNTAAFCPVCTAALCSGCFSADEQPRHMCVNNKPLPLILDPRFQLNPDAAPQIIFASVTPEQRTQPVTKPEPTQIIDFSARVYTPPTSPQASPRSASPASDASNGNAAVTDEAAADFFCSTCNCYTDIMAVCASHSRLLFSCCLATAKTSKPNITTNPKTWCSECLKELNISGKFTLDHTAVFNLLSFLTLTGSKISADQQLFAGQSEIFTQALNKNKIWVEFLQSNLKKSLHASTAVINADLICFFYAYLAIEHYLLGSSFTLKDVAQPLYDEHLYSIVTLMKVNYYAIRVLFEPDLSSSVKQDLTAIDFNQQTTLNTLYIFYNNNQQVLKDPNTLQECLNEFIDKIKQISDINYLTPQNKKQILYSHVDEDEAPKIINDLAFMHLDNNLSTIEQYCRIVRCLQMFKIPVSPTGLDGATFNSHKQFIQALLRLYFQFLAYYLFPSPDYVFEPTDFFAPVIPKILPDDYLLQIEKNIDLLPDEIMKLYQPQVSTPAIAAANPALQKKPPLPPKPSSFQNLVPHPPLGQKQRPPVAAKPKGPRKGSPPPVAPRPGRPPTTQMAPVPPPPPPQSAKPGRQGPPPPPPQSTKPGRQGSPPPPPLPPPLWKK